LRRAATAQILDGSQAVELLRRCEVLIDVFCEVQLSFLYHIHKFYSCDGSCCGMNFPEAPHRTGDPLNMPMILFNYIVEIFDLADFKISFGS